jgi:hypothetical protein
MSDRSEALKQTQAARAGVRAPGCFLQVVLGIRLNLSLAIPQVASQKARVRRSLRHGEGRPTPSKLYRAANRPKII